MKKLTILLSTAGVLAIGWSAIVLNVMNDEPAEVETYTMQSQPVEPAEEAPVAVSEPVGDVLEPKTVNVPVEPVTPVVEPEIPYWQQFLNEKMASDPDAPYIIRCITNTERTGPTIGVMAPSIWGYAPDEKKSEIVEYYYNGFARFIFRQGGTGEILDRVC